MSDFAQQVSGWETFYLLTGTAAATLIGLLFVAISVGRESIEAKATRDLSLFGALTFNCFLYVLVISIHFLIPELSRTWLGLPLVVLGLLALIGVAGGKVHSVRPLWNGGFKSFRRAHLLARSDHWHWLWDCPRCELEPVWSGGGGHPVAGLCLAKRVVPIDAGTQSIA
jgi:CDP-diglyceride synthetase